MFGARSPPSRRGGEGRRCLVRQQRLEFVSRQLLFCHLINEVDGASACNPAETSPVEPTRPHYANIIAFPGCLRDVAMLGRSHQHTLPASPSIQLSAVSFQLSAFGHYEAEVAHISILRAFGAMAQGTSGSNHGLCRVAGCSSQIEPEAVAVLRALGTRHVCEYNSCRQQMTS